MWLIFRDISGSGTQLLLWRAWPSALSSPWPPNQTVAPFWETAGILHDVLWWSPFFQPELRWEKKKNHLLILLGYCFTVCPQPQNSRTSDSCDSRPQRGLGLTVTFSPGDKQEALAQSWVHIISRADLDGFDRGEGEWGGWGPYTRREDHSPKTGSQETSYLELDQTIPGQSVLLFHLQSPTTSSLPGKQWPRWLKMLESELTAPQIPCNFHILWSHCACMVLLWACFVAVVVLSWQMLKMLRQRTATTPCSTDIIHTC